MIFLRKIRFSLVLLTIFCGTVFLYSADKPGTVRIINTTDIHGELESKAESGAARLATIIKDVRAKAGGQDNVLLADCGDLLQGSYAATLDKGESMVDFLNLLSYDVWVPGNHDFDFGVNVFLSRARKFKGTILAANLEFTNPAKPPANLKKWEMFSRGGLKIAVIGMTSPYLDTWLWGPQIENIRALPIGDSLEKILPDVMASGADAIVMFVHNGEFTAQRLRNADGDTDDELGAMSRKYPQINMIAAGHSHQACPGKLIGVKTWFVQAPPHAEGVAVCDLSYDPARRLIGNIKSLIFSAKGQEEDTEAVKLFADVSKKAEKTGCEVMGETNVALGPLKKNETSNALTDMFGAALCEATGAKIAFHGTLNNYTVQPGKITERDLFMLAPYENPLVILNLSPSECRTIIEEQLADRKRTVFQAPYGVKYTVDNAAGTVSSLKVGDDMRGWNDEEIRIRAVVAGYYAAGAGGRFPELRRITQSVGTEAVYGGMGTRDALKIYLKKHRPPEQKE